MKSAQITREAVRCPPRPRWVGDLAGCGSTNIEGPDEEKLYDCLNCGLWFTFEAQCDSPKRPHNTA